jgi:DNA-binding NtrC family response regulator
MLRCQGLRDAGMTRTEAAKELGVCVSTLAKKLKWVGLSWRRGTDQQARKPGRVSCHLRS